MALTTTVGRVLSARQSPGAELSRPPLLSPRTETISGAGRRRAGAWFRSAGMGTGETLMQKSRRLKFITQIVLWRNSGDIRRETVRCYPQTRRLVAS